MKNHVFCESVTFNTLSFIHITWSPITGLVHSITLVCLWKTIYKIWSELTSRNELCSG